MDSIPSLLGLALRAGRLAVGEEPVGAACRGHKAYLLLLASDAARKEQTSGLAGLSRPGRDGGGFI